MQGFHKKKTDKNFGIVIKRYIRSGNGKSVLNWKESYRNFEIYLNASS